MQNENDFNAIAPFYDWLSTLIFGQKLKQAQIESLQFIQPNSTILIAGGGTGWILEEIAKVFPSGLSITYLDKSSKMIALSRKRNVGSNKVDFINITIEETPSALERYDVIITPFFLDCFSQTTFQSVFKKLGDSLKINGLWLNIDFHLSGQSLFWQKILIRLMYAFFRISSHIEAARLPNIDATFSNYILIDKKTYGSNFIHRQVFQKSR
jgi:ubiquinone/menaquinone biosynthesis C-methylase UbiE